MLHKVSKYLTHRWHTCSLRAKLLIPIVGLMLLSLLGSTVAFVVGTKLTQNRLLDRQISGDTQIVADAMALRTQDVSTAAALLANDPSVQQAAQLDTEQALRILNERALRIHNRFSLDLIQIYNHQGQARTNLVLSSLYRESLLIGLVEADTAVIQETGGRVLLLSRAVMPSSLGTVIVGIDLETDLHRIVSQYRLGSDLGLTFGDIQMTTREGFSFDVADGRHGSWYSRRVSLQLGGETLSLLLTRSVTGIQHITTTGLMVMSGSMLFTTLLLTGLGSVVTWLIARPIRRLAAAAEAIAQGDMNQQVPVKGQDEIGLLAVSFNSMVSQLRSLYGNLEAKVAARTHELKTSADVARAVSSSLDLNAILQKTTQLIRRQLGFYYVGIYLIESDANVAVLRGATGKKGRQLKTQGYQVLIGSNCPVGRAVTSGQPSVIDDVRVMQEHLKPPLLLDTYSAVAIPLLVGQTVIGVIDVQSSRRYAFTSEQVNLLTALANQIATGIHNAQLYAQQQRMVEQLAEADRLKSQFLAIISHELRTPLNSIIGFSKLLLNRVSGPLSDAQANDIQIINDAGQHLLFLIQDLLDASQINAGKLRLLFEPVDLHELAGSIIDAVRAMVQEKPISLSMDIEPMMPPIHADRRRLRQVMLNLLSNAAKFTKSGQISVQARTIKAFDPGTESMRPFVEISIQDTGIGIPPDKLEDIFEDFTQADEVTTRRYDGVGLGLSITKRLVELHGGQLWVKSKVNQGSTFTFTLPLERPAIQSPHVIKTVSTVGEEIRYVA